jgi:hypothetical protein
VLQSLAVSNPDYSQNGPAIYLASTGFNFTVAPTLVVHSVTTYDAPLYVSGFLVQIIRQSTPSQGAVNTITIQLVTNVDFTGNITVSGLTGSTTATQPLTLKNQDPEFKSAAWRRSGGVLVVYAQGLVQNVSYVFAVELVNPDEGQVSPRIEVRGDGTDLIPTTNMTKGPLNEAPLLVAGFVDARISQSTTSQFASNTILVSARTVAGFSLPQGAVVRISNLLSSTTPSTASLAILCHPPSAFASTAVWNQTAGFLDVTVGMCCCPSVPVPCPCPPPLKQCAIDGANCPVEMFLILLSECSKHTLRQLQSR